MTNKSRFSALSLLGILTLAATCSACGDEDPAPATLPYKQLWLLANPDGLPKEYKSEISFRVTEYGKSLPPPDLKLHIQFRDKKVPLLVSEQGELRLPQNRDWADGDAMVVANQPKGSMGMEFKFKFSGSMDVPLGEMKYSDLMVASHVLNGISTPLTALTGQKLDERSFAVRFQLKDNKSEKREIIIHSDDGKVTYRANDDGLIILPYKRLLFDQNPKIEVPEGIYCFEFIVGSEQGSADKPATRPESKPEGSGKPQPESEGCSR